MGHNAGKSKTFWRSITRSFPPLDLEQDNIPLNPPNQSPRFASRRRKINNIRQRNQICPPKSEEPGQLGQPDLPPNQPYQPKQPNQPPNQVQNVPAAMAHPQQLNWSYFKPEVSGKARGRCRGTSSQDQVTGWRHIISQRTKR